MPLSSYVLDNGLAQLQSEADKLYVCNAQPTTFTEATATFALGNKNWGAGNVMSGPSAWGSGRRVIVNAITNGVETGAGTATWWAIVDSVNSRLLATDALNVSHSIATGVAFTLPEFDILVPNGFDYVGPGDVVPGARGWWGLRAYSLATIGSRAIRLKRSSDSAEQDFVTLINGDLDVASITTFKGASTLTVTTWYDQSGAGFDLTYVPFPVPFSLNALGSFPAIVGDGLTELASGTTDWTQAQPFMNSIVFKYTNSGTQAVPWGKTAGLNTTTAGISDLAGAANNFGFTAGTNFSASGVADNAYHAAQSTINGASSEIYVDGVVLASGNAGSAGYPAGEQLRVLGLSGGNRWTGNLHELGFWSGTWTSAQKIAMHSVQRGYWGF